MVAYELRQFIQENEEYEGLCSNLLENLHLSESTVAALTRCGTNTGTAFLSHNFTRVFGYPRKQFTGGDLQFLLKHIHPDDLQPFIFFAERSTLDATPWKEAKEKAVHECCSRVKRQNGTWIWIHQRVIVLSVTRDRHIDIALLLFDDCTATKEAEHNQHTGLVEKSRKKSKLLEVLAPVRDGQTKRDKVLDGLEEPASLTRREKEIMQLISQGFSSKEIAGKLFISRHTVESHRKHILQKLNVKNAPQMVHQSVMSSFAQPS